MTYCFYYYDDGFVSYGHFLSLRFFSPYVVVSESHQCIVARVWEQAGAERGSERHTGRHLDALLYVPR